MSREAVTRGARARVRFVTPLVLALLVVLPPHAALAASTDGGPPEWSLSQNNPDPYCPTITSTEITITAPEPAHILLVVHDDFGQVLRTLIDHVLLDGIHAVLWDGANEGGTILPDGEYAYTVVATGLGKDPERGAGLPVLFEDTKIARVSCSLPVERLDWSRIKARFR